jgi:photosystem II stability/assembly factor-like uncharacterized protein
MDGSTKICPMCAETIPLEAASCEYCGARFAVTVRGYCKVCHEIRNADADGRCKVCGAEVADRQVESKFIEGTAPRPATSPTSSQPIPIPPLPEKKKIRIFIGIGALGLLALIVGFGVMVFQKNIPLPAALRTTTKGTMVATHTPATALGSAPTFLPTLPPTPGPTNVPWKWIPLNDGREFPRDTVSAIAIDPRNPDGLYIGTENSGLYKTTDGGQTWKPQYNGVTGASVESLMVDPNNPNTLYAALNGELLQSMDGGESWQRVLFDPKEDWCGGSVLLADPHGHGKLYAAGVCLFVREGADWIRVKDADLCPDRISSLAVHPSDENTLLATQQSWSSERCEGGIYLTVDGGREWKLLPSWKEGEPSSVTWNIDPQGKEEIYVIAGGNLMVSLDRGAAWNVVGKVFTKGMVATADGYLIVYYGNKLFKVTNHGNSWESLSTPSLHSFRTLVISSDDPSRIYLGGEYLLASTDGGRRWKKTADGIGAAALDLRIAPRDVSLLYLLKDIEPSKFGEYDSIQLFRSNDSGQAWKLINPRGLGLALDADGQTIYRFWRGSDWEHNRLLRSPDRGETWQEMSSLSMYKTDIRDIVAHPSISGIIYVEFEFDTTLPGFLVSTDRGIFWQKVDWTVMNASQTDPSHPSYELSFLPSPSLSPLAFLFRAYGSEFFRSVDEGSTWSPCGSVDYVHSETRLIIDPRDSNRMYIAASDGVYLSTDGCQSWQERTTGIGYQRVNTLAIDPVDPDILYAGTGIGAYVSRDAGQTWILTNEGLTGTPAVYSIVVDSQSNVYAATPYGVFRLKRR